MRFAGCTPELPFRSPEHFSSPRCCWYRRPRGCAADFQNRIYHDQAGDHKYTIFVPAGYTPDQNWPVILYLHGASTRGRDGRMQLVDGLAPLVRARAATFPFIVVFPQCEDTDSRIFEGWLARTDDAQWCCKMLDQVEQDFRVDRRREILTGMSMGGYGAWSIAAATPSRWSAVVVLSGAANPAEAERLKNVPVWSLHGTKDPAVRIDNARLMVDALKAAGGTAYLTELPGAAHYISHVVYSDDVVYAWMLNPASAPKAGNIVRNAARNPTSQELGFDVNPFVPAIEIPESIYVHADNRILEALGYAFPDMLPGRSVSGAMSNKYEVKQSGPFRFDIAMAGLSYRGELEARGADDPRRRLDHAQPGTAKPDHGDRLHRGQRPACRSHRGAHGYRHRSPAARLALCRPAALRGTASTPLRERRRPF